MPFQKAIQVSNTAPVTTALKDSRPKKKYIFLRGYELIKKNTVIAIYEIL